MLWLHDWHVNYDWAQDCVFANEEDLDNAATQSEENSQKLARDSHASPLLADKFAGFLFVFRLTDLDLQ